MTFFPPKYKDETELRRSGSISKKATVRLQSSQVYSFSLQSVPF